MKKREVPKETVNRLPIYLRCFERLLEEDEYTVTSEGLSRRLNLNSYLVRKDLSRFGDFGTRGVGYKTRKLAEKLRSILHVNRKWKVALAGVGNVGLALLTYKGFKRKVFDITVAFESNPELIGKTVNGVTIEDEQELVRRVQGESVKLGIIAVPHAEAQRVAEKMVEGGVQGLLNFAPTQLDLPDDVRITQMFFTKELETLVYYL